MGVAQHHRTMLHGRAQSASQIHRWKGPARSSPSREQRLAFSQKIDEEWKNLPDAPSTTNTATKEKYYQTASEHQQHNRYQDVLPLETTLVKLEDSSDYVNANYIRSIPHFQCIATQAPLPQGFDAFWKMLWEKGVRVVVMLSRFVEKRKVKAHCYWPCEEQAEVFKDITVVLEQTHQICEGIVAHRLVMLRGNESRKLVHLHYTEWPDFGVPLSTSRIRKLRSLVEAFKHELESSDPIHHMAGSDKYPVVVHCSAGIGRAGTFLSFMCFCELRKSGVPVEEISISDIVSSLRQERMSMVQTKAQYEFIYQLVEDEIADLTEEDTTNALITDLRSPNSLRSSGSRISHKSNRPACTRSFLRSTQCGTNPLSVFTA